MREAEGKGGGQSTVQSMIKKNEVIPNVITIDTQSYAKQNRCKRFRSFKISSLHSVNN